MIRGEGTEYTDLTSAAYLSGFQLEKKKEEKHRRKRDGENEEQDTIIYIGCRSVQGRERSGEGPRRFVARFLHCGSLSLFYDSYLVSCLFSKF